MDKGEGEGTAGFVSDVGLGGWLVVLSVSGGGGGEEGLKRGVTAG